MINICLILGLTSLITSFLSHFVYLSPPADIWLMSQATGRTI